MKKVVIFLSIILAHTTAKKTLPSKLSLADFESDYAANRQHETTILMWPWAETKDSVIWTIPKSFEFGRRLENKVLPEKCGSCLLTSNKLHAKTADMIFFQTTTLFGHLGHWGTKDLSPIKTFPDPFERPDWQYWMGWFKESASKGFNAIPMLRENTGHFAGFDTAFNLTMDVRRDADVYFAHLGNVGQLYSHHANLKVPNSSILAHKTAKNLASSMISNCDKTPQAKLRMKAVGALLTAGLTLTGVGRCYHNHPSENVDYIPDRFDDDAKSRFNTASIKKHKFYLS